MDELAADLERMATAMEVYRMRTHARRLIRGAEMALKFPIAQSLAGEISKLCDAVEADAMEVIQKDIPAMHTKRLMLKAKAKQKVADVGSAVAEVGDFLDELDAALEGSNSGERSPTFGDSSKPQEAAVDSPKQVDPALPQAGTIAAPAGSADPPRTFDAGRR